MQSTIERISSEALLHAQSEVSKLIGAGLELNLQSASLIKKQGYLEILSGRNSIIGLTMSGIYEGEGCLVTAEKSVVRLGGKMLMLPAAELNDIISSANYKDEEELRYAFDEIAKCFVVSFLEPLQNDNAFISTIACQKQKIADGRKETSDILNYLSTEQTYYEVSAKMSMAGAPVNGLSLLLPAYVLVCSEPFQKHAGQHTTQSSIESGAQSIEQASLVASHLTALFNLEEVSSNGANNFLMSHLLSALQTELGNLLGGSVRIAEKGTTVALLAEILPQVDSAAHLRTSLSFNGSADGKGWLITEMTDATRLGLLLTDGVDRGLSQISLTSPISADCQDGYNEICSILTDVLSFVCMELSEGELFLEKTASFEYTEDSEEPSQYDGSSGSSYRLSALELAVDGVACGRLYLLLPTFVHDYFQKVDDPLTTGKAGNILELESTTNEMSRATEKNLEPYRQTDSTPRVLIIEAAEDCAAEMLKALTAGGITWDGISMAEELHKPNIESYQAIIMVVEKLDEIALGMVIKIKSISSVPLLVAASKWTQTGVMKALRYGVDDIVMLPVDREELFQKIRGLEPLSV